MVGKLGDNHILVRVWVDFCYGQGGREKGDRACQSRNVTDRAEHGQLQQDGVRTSCSEVGGFRQVQGFSVVSLLGQPVGVGMFQNMIKGGGLSRT